MKMQGELNDGEIVEILSGIVPVKGVLGPTKCDDANIRNPELKTIRLTQPSSSQNEQKVNRTHVAEDRLRFSS